MLWLQLVVFLIVPFASQDWIKKREGILSFFLVFNLVCQLFDVIGNGVIADAVVDEIAG